MCVALIGFITGVDPAPTSPTAHGWFSVHGPFAVQPWSTAGMSSLDRRELSPSPAPAQDAPRFDTSGAYWRCPTCKSRDPGVKFAKGDSGFGPKPIPCDDPCHYTSGLYWPD